jgi:hypothetical protein
VLRGLRATRRLLRTAPQSCSRRISRTYRYKSLVSPTDTSPCSTRILVPLTSGRQHHRRRRPRLRTHTHPWRRQHQAHKAGRRHDNARRALATPLPVPVPKSAVNSAVTTAVAYQIMKNDLDCIGTVAEPRIGYATVEALSHRLCESASSRICLVSHRVCERASSRIG